MAVLRLAWRSIWRHHWRSGISAFAIGSALFMMVFLTAVGEGMYNQMIRDALNRSTGHLVIQHKDFLDKPSIERTVMVAQKDLEALATTPGVVTIKHAVLAQGVAKSGRGQSGTAIYGVDAAAEKSTSPVYEKMVEGEGLEPGDKRKAMIGTRLAERLKLKVGKKFVIASTDKNGDIVEQLVRVKGIFRLGSPELDGHLVYVPIDFSRMMFGLAKDESSQVGVMLDSDDLRPLFVDKLAPLAKGDAQVLSWEQVLADLKNYVEMDRASNQIFYGIMMLISLFTIFNTILMSVLERNREFAMMMALGTTPGRVRLQVLLESSFLGLLGVGFGLLTGFGLSTFLGRVGLDMSAMYGDELDVSGFAMETIIYPYIDFPILFTQGLIVYVAVLAVSLFSLRHVNRIPIADVLR